MRNHNPSENINGVMDSQNNQYHAFKNNSKQSHPHHEYIPNIIVLKGTKHRGADMARIKEI